MMNAKGMDPHVDHAEFLIENITDCIAEVLVHYGSNDNKDGSKHVGDLGNTSFSIS